jgi:hypothetical protein
MIEGWGSQRRLQLANAGLGALFDGNLNAGQVSHLDSFLTLIEITCAGVTELPSAKDARHC